MTIAFGVLGTAVCVFAGGDATTYAGRGEVWPALLECIKAGGRTEVYWTNNPDALTTIALDEIPDDMVTGHVRPFLTESGCVGLQVGQAYIRGVGNYVPMDESGDAEALARRAHAFGAEIEKECEPLGLRPGLSGSSTGFRLWNEVFNIHGAHNLPNRGAVEVWDHVRDGYYGGCCRVLCGDLVCMRGRVPSVSRREWIGRRTRLLPSGWRIWTIDRNSAFPAEMLKPLPWVWDRDGWRYATTLPDPDDERRHGVHMGVAYVSITLPGSGPAVLPVRRGVGRGRYVLEWHNAGEHVGAWTLSTLRAAVAHGATITAVETSVSWPQSYRPFRRFTPWIFERAAARSGIGRQVLKTFSRRVYGRLAQDRIRTRVVALERLRDWYAEARRLGTPGAHVMTDEGELLLKAHGRRGGLVLITVQSREYPVHANPAWAAEITARSNLHLAESIDALERAGNLPLYCDTDAITFAGPADSRGNPAEVPDSIPMGGGLGEWKLAARHGWFVAFEQKKWMADNDCAFAGVPVNEQRRVFWARHVVISHRRNFRGVFTGEKSEVGVHWTTPAGGFRDVRSQRQGRAAPVEHPARAAAAAARAEAGPGAVG